MRYLKGNKNIVVDDDNQMVSFQPYTIELCLDSIKRMIQTTVRNVPNCYGVYLGGKHNFDGLYETNVLLLKQGGILQDNYTGNYRTISKVEA